MSLVIFFGMAACIFILGVIVISVTVYQWVQVYKENKKIKLGLQSSIQSNIQLQSTATAETSK